MILQGGVRTCREGPVAARRVAAARHAAVGTNVVIGLTDAITDAEASNRSGGNVS
jgi:hypothetical protein